MSVETPIEGRSSVAPVSAVRGCLNPRASPSGFVPCRHCKNCKKTAKRIWIGRLSAESFTSDHTFFVTLTYDDDHLHSSVMNVEHVNDFLAAVRKHCTVKCFGVFEFGDKYGRPHWHLLLFIKGRPPPIKALDFSCVQYGWAKGNSQWEIPRSVAGSVAYVMDYIDKGGVKKRPSNGIGKKFLLRYARMQGNNGRPLCDDYGIVYRVPGCVSKQGKAWYYRFPFSHDWSPLIAGEYLRAVEEKWPQKLAACIENVKRIDVDY